MHLDQLEKVVYNNEHSHDSNYRSITLEHDELSIEYKTIPYIYI